MAIVENETKPTQTVDLDLDGVNEEKVSVEEQQPKEDNKPNLDLGEVDLGYTSYDKNEKPVIEETTEEAPFEEKTAKEEDPSNLSDMTEGVQKRIDKLTRKFREAERRERAALDYAKGLQKKYDGMTTKADHEEEGYLKEFDARVDAQRDTVKRSLKEAIENNDAEKIMEMNDKLTQLAVEKEKARIKLSQREERIKAAQEEKPETLEQNLEQPETAQRPEPSERAKKWASDNSWFGNDKIMTNAAYTIHEELVGMGVDAESDEYYNEINKRMKDNFPHKFASDNTSETKKPVQTVASAGRKQAGRRTVKLTKSQVAIAKKLGVPLEEYAKFVKEV